jgi:hypothetical protein
MHTRPLHRRPPWQTFKHTTSSSITLNRFTALNTLLFEKMAGTSLTPPPPPAPTAPAGAVMTDGSASAGATTLAADAMDGVEPAPQAAAAAGGGNSVPGGGAKKKKKGKGKK